MVVLFLPMTSRSQVGQLSATLYSQGTNPQDSIAQAWDSPQKNWHSVLFAGPLVKARFFCQDISPSKNLNITYDRNSGSQISMSQTPTISKQELLQTGSVQQKNTLTLFPDSTESSFYSAGENSQTPYWLTFSLPVHSPHDIKTTIKYSFP
jgi:hypothetical protein